MLLFRVYRLHNRTLILSRCNCLRMADKENELVHHIPVQALMVIPGCLQFLACNDYADGRIGVYVITSAMPIPARNAIAAGEKQASFCQGKISCFYFRTFWSYVISLSTSLIFNDQLIISNVQFFPALLLYQFLWVLVPL